MIITANNNITLYSLRRNDIRTYLFALMFIAGNVVLPQLCHLLPHGGVTWLPIFFFTLIGAYKYGWRVGLLTAMLSPAINAVLFGMPAISALPIITIKSSLLALIAGAVASHSRKVTISMLLAVVAGYQFIGSIAEWLLTGSLMTALQDLRIGLPGIALQVIGGWAVIRWMLRK